jgi:phosphoribosylformylglycinamidine synthase
MHWEIEIRPKGSDPERMRLAEDYNLLTHSKRGPEIVLGSARGYLLPGDLDRAQVQSLMDQLLIDPLVESGELREAGVIEGLASNGRADEKAPGSSVMVTVLLRPGVMDPTAMSVVEAARDLGIQVATVRTFRRYYLNPAAGPHPLHEDVALRKVLANDAIEQIIEGWPSGEHLSLGGSYIFRLITCPLRDLDDSGLMELSRRGQLSLILAEMQTIQSYFRELQRDPTDVELETIAQTWSEHCSHKTLKGRIEFNGRRIDNLLKETIFGATQEIRGRLGPQDWCVSVFEDNAGIVRFDDRFNVCFKVETHNHPSALEPYGGANTGIGGVIRDVLGTGLGARPICNTDVFCFAPPDTPAESLPPGVLHPRKVMKGVVAGVRDYGNRMGIPTVNGAVCFDPRYLGNPLVYCGTVGLIPVDACRKAAQPGDLIVALGGRTGRDGIHGATFSSAELTSESEATSGGAVQIGNAITEKKLLDVLMQARDQGLYNAVTDCGAGGFSSAVGEMGEELGAVVQLERAPLKYEGLSYTEIWISESQERMVLAVPPGKIAALQALCSGEDVEASVIGTFEPSGRLRLSYEGTQVAELDMKFLHRGRPPVVRQAVWSASGSAAPQATRSAKTPRGYTDVLVRILSSYNVCSKEWIVRQYDHEVQGGTVIKPLVGVQQDGPGDAAVICPVLGSFAGVAIGCGINPRYGDLDPYWMAIAAVDEAARNVVAVGADPRRIALLDNFCWGNSDRPEVLGSLVRAAEGCRDAALAFGMPFISGKDSLNNEYRAGGQNISIPGTLLISALGLVHDVRRCMTMDLKEPGNVLYLVGQTRDELGGSHYHLVEGLSGGAVPRTDLGLAPRVLQKVHEAIERGLVRACHDLSEGGLATALAEMAIAGRIGADVTNPAGAASGPGDEVSLFAESTTRFIVEVAAANAGAFEKVMGGVPCSRIGQTCKEPRLRIAGGSGEWVVWAQLGDLKEAWQRPLRW